MWELEQGPLLESVWCVEDEGQNISQWHWGGGIEDVLKISKVKCCAVVCSTTAQDMHQQGNTDIT